MEGPFLRNCRSYQQPSLSPYALSHAPALRGAPAYQGDPAWEAQRPGRSIQRLPERNTASRVVRIPVQFVGSEQVDRSGAALKIQKVFRGFLVRKCLKKIKDIDAQVNESEERLSNSEVVEMLRRDEKERLRMNESLMSLLLKLDSVSGVDFGVKGYRKAVIRKAIALQERIDAIVVAGLGEDGDNGEAVDRVKEISISANADGSNQAKLKECSENAESFEGSSKYPENLWDVSCVEGGNNTMKMKAERNDGDAGIIDAGVDREVKVGEANCVGDDINQNLGLVEECVDGAKESLNDGGEKQKSNRAEGGSEGKPNEGNVEDDRRRNRELLERMKEDNEKMMNMMTDLLERNVTQTGMLNALKQRVGMLEKKAFVCDKPRRKKKAARRREN